MEQENRSSDISTKLLYFLIGSSIGALVALLFAPKSGEELRHDIADATRKGIDRTRETAAQLGETATEYYDSTREKAAEFYSTASEKATAAAASAREAAAKKTGQVAAAIEAGKRAYTEEKGKGDVSRIIEGG